MLYIEAVQLLDKTCLPSIEQINVGDKFKFAELVPIQGIFETKQKNLSDQYAIVYHNAKVIKCFESTGKELLDNYYLVSFPTGERSIKFRWEIMERVDYVES